MVLSVCQDYALAHNQDVLVLTRHKEPSMFTRQAILKVLKSKLLMQDD